MLSKANARQKSTDLEAESAEALRNTVMSPKPPESRAVEDVETPEMVAGGLGHVFVNHEGDERRVSETPLAYSSDDDHYTTPLQRIPRTGSVQELISLR